MRPFCLFLVTIVNCCFAALAQTGQMIHFGVEDGVSNNYIVGLTQDERGYIWIATEDGLNRFDGREFTIYTKQNSGLSSNELNCVLAVPGTDRVWIGTQRDGLCYFDYNTEKITHLSASRNGLASNDIPHLDIASDGGLWVTHYHMGVQHYCPEKGIYTLYNHRLMEGMPTQCWLGKEDGMGHLYIGHVHDGMSIVDLNTQTYRNYRHDAAHPDSSLPGDEVYSICIDHNKNVWIGTNRGAALFDPKTEKFTVFRHHADDNQSLLPGNIMDIKQMENGEIWMATNMGGVSILNLQDNAFNGTQRIRFRNLTATGNASGLSGPFVRQMLQDSFGNIWLGNYRNGLDFISYEPPHFSILPYTNRQQIGDNRYKQVWSLAIDRQKRIWMGGESELVSCRDNEKIEVIRLPSSASHPHAYIRTLMPDRHGTIWIGTWEAGLLCYNPTTRQFSRINRENERPIDIRSLYEDPDGTIWIGARSGLYTYSNGKLHYEEMINAQMNDHIVQTICRDAQGCLWIGTFGKGIFIFDRSNKLIQHHEASNGLPSNAINAMISDSHHRIWAATREGLILFPDIDIPDRFTVFGTGEGLNSILVRAICEDRDGNIWISTNRGISRLNEAKKTFYTYDHRDGLPLGNFMDGAALCTDNGTLYFASQNGVCHFTPSILSAAQIAAPVVITGFHVFSRQTESRDRESAVPLTGWNEGKIVLPYDQNTFSLSFNVLDYTQYPLTEFSYKLEGLEDVWYNAQDESRITFRNIPPGKYRFKVRSRLRGEEWNKNEAQLAITIRPPFYLDWYAMVFYLLVLITIVILLLKAYKEHIEQKGALLLERRDNENKQALNNERLRFYTNITHELRTPLTLILGPLEDLLSDKTLSPKHANRISIIYDSATRLLNLVNGILEFRKTETQNRKLTVAKDNLAKLILGIGLQYKELNQNNKVSYNICIETDKTQLFYDADMITTIIENLLSNATKYTAQGSITLAMRAVEEQGVAYTEISVSDTGYGITPEALPHIFDRYYQAGSKYQAGGSGIGLALVKGLVELHQGTLSVSSQVDVGTTFSIRLLTDNTYPDALHTEPKRPAELAGTPAETEETESEKPLLLIIEDNSDILHYISESLCEHYEILTAHNGFEGWEIAQEQIPSLIVSDIMMPVMDGIELCKKVKEDIRTSHIPVILLTAKDTLKDKEEGYRIGADSYLTKPFSANLLQSRIVNLLDARKKLAEQLAANTTAQLHTPPGKENIADFPPADNPLDNKFLQRVRQIIEENLEMEKMDIAFIAEKMCMSHSTLYRKIKAVTDISTNEFIRKVKMHNAVKMLRNEDLSISEVAYRTGFSSVAYFRQCFKTEFGMTPGEYLKR